MITTAAPAWLRRSDQAFHWARAMLQRDRAVVIDCETTDLPGALLATTVIRTCGIAREQDCSADGKAHDSGTLGLERDLQTTFRPRSGIPGDAGVMHLRGELSHSSFGCEGIDRTSGLITVCRWRLESPAGVTSPDRPERGR